MAKATDKVKVTAKDGGETSPTRTKVGGEAMARKTKATQKNDKTEKIQRKGQEQRETTSLSILREAGTRQQRVF